MIIYRTETSKMLLWTKSEMHDMHYQNIDICVQIHTDSHKQKFALDFIRIYLEKFFYIFSSAIRYYARKRQNSSI